MPRTSWPHRLAELMEQHRLTDAGLAAHVEPRTDHKHQDYMRARIVKYRHGTKMTMPTAEKFAAALTAATGSTIGVRDLLLEEMPPATEEDRLARLEGQVEDLLGLVRRILGELEDRGEGRQDGPRARTARPLAFPQSLGAAAKRSPLC